VKSRFLALRLCRRLLDGELDITGTRLRKSGKLQSTKNHENDNQNGERSEMICGG
jgi:hypothetical protein